jgi:hypothetical protein
MLHIDQHAACTVVFYDARARFAKNTRLRVCRLRQLHAGMLPRRRAARF